LPAADVEQLTPDQRAGELAMLLLRLSDGLNFDVFADRSGRKLMIVIGMWMQAAGILIVATAPTLAHSPAENFSLWIFGSVLLGVGTALVYPTLLAAISDVAHPDWRASAVGG